MSLDTASIKTLKASDGHEFSCYMQPAKNEAVGGLVIIQEIFGVTDQMKGVAADYAEKGFDVAIPALFDRCQRDTVVPFDQHQRGLDLMAQCPNDTALLDIEAAVKALSVPVAVMGFCWGGGLALAAAQQLDIKSAVSFYGTKVHNFLGRPFKAPVLFHAGSEDAHLPQDVLDALRSANNVDLKFYKGADHAFANSARPKPYHPEAASLAHERSLAFLLSRINSVPETT